MLALNLALFTIFVALPVGVTMLLVALCLRSGRPMPQPPDNQLDSQVINAIAANNSSQNRQSDSPESFSNCRRTSSICHPFDPPSNMRLCGRLNHRLLS